jgi:pyrroline-5-carboxylate reductase
MAPSSPTHPKLAFIGAGNMASSIIGGLIQQGYSAQALYACDPNTEALNHLQKRFNIHTSADNITVCQHCDVIVLAVKPQILKQVCQGLQTPLSQRNGKPPLVMSVAAGISSEQIQTWLEQQQPVAIIRCMPNTPALVQQGASGLYANEQASDAQKQIAQSLLEAVGYVTWLENEDLIDAVTAVSGSGPAYFFLLMEAMIDAGMKQGLNRESATQLTLQTALGAATLAMKGDITVEELRHRVTSRGGTTEQAILSYENAGLRTIVDDAMTACAERSHTMAKEFH